MDHFDISDERSDALRGIIHVLNTLNTSNYRIFNSGTDVYPDHLDLSLPSGVEMMVEHAPRLGYAKIKIFHVEDETPFALTSEVPSVESLGIFLYPCGDIVASNGSQPAKLFAAGEMIAEGTLRRTLGADSTKCFQCIVADEASFVRMIDIVTNFN